MNSFWRREAAAASVLFTTILFLILSGIPAQASGAWWNGEWAFRKKIQLDTTGAGADIKENLNDFPMLVRLHAGNFNFAGATKDGSDIRFVSADDKIVLKHHIEKYDPVDQMALIWVLVPKVPGGSNQDFIWLYYGNASAPGIPDAKGTFDPGYVGVYHFGETEGPPRDQTGFGNHATEFTGTQGLPSVIGSGIALNGAVDRMLIPKSPSIDFTAAFGFSSWVKITEPQKEAYLFTTESEDQGLTIWMEGTKLFARIATAKNQAVRLTEGADLPLDTWQHVCVTAEPKGRLTLYLNGLSVTWKDFPGTMPQAKAGISIGASLKGTNAFVGELDEMKISNKPRTEGWARAVFKSEAPDQQFQVVGDEESNDKGYEKLAEQIRYFKVIIKSMSLDGWGAILVLFVFGLVALGVVFTKTFTLIMVRRGNIAFLDAFEDIKDYTSPVAEEGSFSQSTLHRVHTTGLSELSRLLKGSASAMDSARVQRVLNACKAAMDRGLVEESRKLNSWMVILTMAISGGPFLGLLGTVFGVMNTFAAMADAGEANLAAIAPGVASALAATVSGLLVAIPALFAYNYLASKIKGITAEMSSFVDYFSLKLEGSLGGRE